MLTGILEGKIAIVTGAGRGIGEAAALSVARAGAVVAVNYNHSADQAQAVVNEIVNNGGRAKAWQCDVSSFDDCGAFFSDVIKEFGRLDILVNNAGVTRDGLLMRMTEADYDLVMDVNLKGTFHGIRHAARQMVKQKYGRIINISSVVGITGNGGQANYAASKAGIIGLTKSAAKELGSRGITVNTVAPGFIETEMTAVLPEEQKSKLASQIPLGRFGQPEDVAAAIVFLASEYGAYITGQVLQVDGGMVM